MRAALFLASTAALVLATTVAGQSPATTGSPRYLSATVFAASSGYDLQGLGRVRSTGLRLAVGLSPALIVEPSVMSFAYVGQSGAGVRYTLAEISLQLQETRGALRFYAGAGAGYAFLRDGPDQSEKTLHAAIGARARVVRHIGLMAEARIRNLTWFRANETIVDYVGGLSLVL